MFKEIPLEAKKDRRGMKRSLVYGIGINDAPYQTTIKINNVLYTCPYFSRWVYMMSRCYGKAWLKNHPTYLGCSVAPVWYSFMAFRSWMMTQQWEGQQLDKDLLSKEKKIYSPETCLFVSSQVNSLFNERENAQGDLPLGIYARNGKFEVGVSVGKAKRTWVGAYDTVPNAIDAYLEAKSKVVRKVANEQNRPEVRQAILEYLAFFTDKHSRLKAGY